MTGRREAHCVRCGSATRSSTNSGDASGGSERSTRVESVATSSAALGGSSGVARGGARLPGLRAVAPTASAALLGRGDAAGYRVRIPMGEPSVTAGKFWDSTWRDRSARGRLRSAPGAPPCPSAPYSSASLRGVEATVSSDGRADASLGALKPVPFPRLISDREIRSCSPRHDRRGALRPAYAPAGAGPRARGRWEPPRQAAGGERLLAVTLRPVEWDSIERRAKALDEITLDVRWNRRSSRRAAGARVPRAGERHGPTTRSARDRPARPRRPPRAARLSRLRPATLRIDLPVPGSGWASSAAALSARPGRPRLAGRVDVRIGPRTFRIFRATPATSPKRRCRSGARFAPGVRDRR